MAQHGNEFLIKLGDGETPEVFTTICGLTSKNLSVNRASIDATTTDCTDPTGVLYQESLGGVFSMTLGGTGTFKRKSDMAALFALQNAKDNSANFEAVLPGLGTWKGAFRVETVDMGGDDTGPLTTGVSLASTGEVTFTEEP